MIVGIVGSEAAKFTPEGRRKAKNLIRKLLSRNDVTEVVSGHCHLGGIDIWAEKIGKEMRLKVTSFAPVTQSWSDGYKPRNLQIAERADEVHCITVNRLPGTYDGMRFKLCYHCGTDTHIKSGGCWTMKQAKQGILHVIKQ